MFLSENLNLSFCEASRSSNAVCVSDLGPSSNRLNPQTLGLKPNFQKCHDDIDVVLETTLLPCSLQAVTGWHIALLLSTSVEAAL